MKTKQMGYLSVKWCVVCEVMQSEVLDCGYIDACAVCQPLLQ